MDAKIQDGDDIFKEMWRLPTQSRKQEGAICKLPSTTDVSCFYLVDVTRLHPSMETAKPSVGTLGKLSQK